LWFSSYLHNRKQCVILHGKKSNLLIQQRGVPQGSTLGPLLFSIYVNNLPSIFNNCCAQLYADDTVLYTSKHDLPQIQACLQYDFKILQDWLLYNKLLLNKTKTYLMIFGTRQKLKSETNACIITCSDGTPLPQVDKFKYLGVWLDSKLSFKIHIGHILRKVNYGINALYRSRNCFTYSVRKKLASQLILPIFDYCDVVYHNSVKSDLSRLKTAYNRLCRFVLGCPFLTHHCTMYSALNWPSLNTRRQIHWLQLIFKIIHFNYPSYLKRYFVLNTSNYNLRHSVQLYFFVPRAKKTVGKRAFMFKATLDWNNLPSNIRSITSFGIFKNNLSSYFMTNCSCFV